MRIRRRPTRQEIARRAYELYEQRHHGDADAARDWLEAERELEAAEAAAESEDTPPGLLEVKDLAHERR
jgi:outer membrane protein TolC